MDRRKQTIIITAAAVVVIAALLPFLFDAKREREERRETAAAEFLAAPLRERMEGDSDILAASVSVVETGTGRKPYSILLARYGNGEEIRKDLYSIDRVPVLPGGMMQAPALTFFIDKKYVKPGTRVSTNHGIVPKLGPEGSVAADPVILSYEMTTGKDSISVREGFLMSSRYVVDRIALDNEDRTWRDFIDKLDDYFGSSEAYFVPRVWDRMLFRPEYASIVDGHGIHLSQAQVLTFYDAIANGGIRPRHRYLRSRRACSEETAAVMAGLLEDNVANGTGVLLAGHPARIAGKTGSGVLRHGYVPGIAREEPRQPVGVASFVGFFPSEAPKYTMCTTFYFKTADGSRGAAIPMDAFGKIAGRLYEEGMPWKK